MPPCPLLQCWSELRAAAIKVEGLVFKTSRRLFSNVTVKSTLKPGGAGGTASSHLDNNSRSCHITACLPLQNVVLFYPDMEPFWNLVFGLYLASKPRASEFMKCGRGGGEFHPQVFLKMSVFYLGPASITLTDFKAYAFYPP